MFVGKYSYTPCVGFVTCFAEFGDLYTLLDVYNISEKLELVHAHYKASTMRLPLCLRPEPPLAALTKSSHSSSRAKTVHLTKASNFRVPRVDVHQENTQFSIDQLMECQLQMHEVVQKHVSTLLFSFQDLKLSTMDIIVVLKDTLNITLGPLRIPDPHATGIPSNTLERHSIDSHVADGVRNLVTSFSMAKLVGFATFNFTITN